MLKIFIQGLKDGEYDVELSSPANKIPDLYPEFFGDIDFKGKMRVFGRRYTVIGRANCKAKLICDLSLNEFEELISTDIKVSFEGLESAGKQKSESIEAEVNQNIIDDDKYLDLSSEIREQLEVSLPMKRIAPEYRDKDFEDIFPEFAAKLPKKGTKKTDGSEIDNRWAPLMNLRQKKS